MTTCFCKNFQSEYLDDNDVERELKPRGKRNFSGSYCVHRKYKDDLNLENKLPGFRPTCKQIKSMQKELFL